MMEIKAEQRHHSLPQERHGIKSNVHSVTGTNTSIYIEHEGHGGGDAVTGVNEITMSKLPPELLRKMREVIAIGVAKSIIAKSLAEVQSKEAVTNS
jgi:hypothetical protein